MYSAAKYILDNISTRLNDILIQYPDYALVICGYSLGAGIGSILAILLKSTYPHLKCYGIAMPGSVLSENLALATRHFIYSYIVDVDMISRTSIHSLENLRNRIIDALGKWQRNKMRILTMTLAQTLTEYQQTFHSINSQTETLFHDPLLPSIDNNLSVSEINLIHSSHEHVHLVMPGTIIHLYSTHRVGLLSCPRSYRAYMSTYDRFSQFIVHPRMWLDHFPATYDKALTDVVKNYGQIS